MTTVKTTTAAFECEVGMLQTFTTTDVGSTIQIFTPDSDDNGKAPSAILFDSQDQYEDSSQGK